MKVVIIGVGNMGSAMVKAWLRAGTVASADLTLFDTNPEKLAQLNGSSTSGEINARLADAEVVVLAIKPQDLDSSAKHIAPMLSSKSVVLSILAGVSIARLAGCFPKCDKIVRAMPNMAARICQSTTGFVVSEAVKAEEASKAANLLSALGAVEQLDSEQLMDAWCAVAGSGPGFIVALMEGFVSAAIAQGFSSDLAEDMVRQTFSGTTAMVRESTLSLAEIKKSVASKGGTTEAGLKILEAQNVSQIIAEMIQAATERGRVLNSK